LRTISELFPVPKSYCGQAGLRGTSQLSERRASVGRGARGCCWRSASAAWRRACLAVSGRVRCLSVRASACLRGVLCPLRWTAAGPVCRAWPCSSAAAAASAGTMSHLLPSW
jgi:hypothetical protein